VSGFSVGAESLKKKSFYCKYEMNSRCFQ